jgi:hypothetical protein
MDIEKFERNVEAKERRIEKDRKESERKAKRMASVEELSLRNRRCHKRAGEIYSATSRSYSEETFILLDQTNRGYMAAKINSKQEMDCYSKNLRYSVVNLYFLNNEEAEIVRENPFVESTGVERIGQPVGQEKAYDLTYGAGGWSDGFKERTVGWRAGKFFDPVGAISRHRQVGKISTSLDEFEQTLDMIESAITDSSLNPALVELDQQRESAQQQTA